MVRKVFLAAALVLYVNVLALGLDAVVHPVDRSNCAVVDASWECG